MRGSLADNEVVKLWPRKKEEPASPGMKRFASLHGDVSFELPEHWRSEKDDGSVHYFDPANRDAFLMVSVMAVRGHAFDDVRPILEQMRVNKYPTGTIEEVSPGVTMFKATRPGEAAGGGNHVLYTFAKPNPRGATIVTCNHFEMSPEVAAMVERALRAMTFR